ncbi:MAG: Maf family protein [Lachnospiraceae bacterium]|nr:Maf family protein [Lachnospiraceae bacterium]
MRIILGSASPRRKELLARMGIDFEVIPLKGEEIITEEDPSDIVTELAVQKAEAVLCELSEGRLFVQRMEACDASTQEENDSVHKTCEADDGLLILGADTVVAYEHRILGKPSDEEDAFRMLHSLSGKTHQVYTGVCMLLVSRESRTEHHFFEKTDVTLYPMEEWEIWEYIRTGDPMDKAGAYGIQGIFGKYVREIHGDYNNVVGLPAARLYQEMKAHGQLLT